jgi:hypothetical protein
LFNYHFQVNAEFKRITTTPLHSKCLSQRDIQSDDLLMSFQEEDSWAEDSYQAWHLWLM